MDATSYCGYPTPSRHHCISPLLCPRHLPPPHLSFFIVPSLPPFCLCPLGLLPVHCPPHALPAFLSSLSSLWHLPFPNLYKEPLWRCALSANPGNHFHPWRCPSCPADSFLGCPRTHTFWTCPCARAIRDTIVAVGIPPILLTRPSLWLLQCPSLPSLSLPVWLAVCAAALETMDYPHRIGWATFPFLSPRHCTLLGYSF